MIASAWRWLRARAWVRWLVVALLMAGAGYLRGRRRERERATAANGDALGAELRADDELDERERERARIEADERAALVRRTREQLAHPPRTTAQARAEAMARLERAARADEEK